MNKNGVIAFSIVCLLAAGTASQADKGEEGAAFFRILDHSYQTHDPAGLVRLAASTAGKDLWTFGGGEGPNDADSLSLRALKLAPQWLFDEHGLLKSDVVTNLGSNLTESEQSLVNHLALDPADTTGMLQLLADPQANVRWIGIYKTRFLTAPPDAIVQALKNVAANDKFVMLVDIEPTGTGPTPVPLHAVAAREFIAPLRVLANEQLTRWNEQIPENPHDVARTGLKRLLSDYATNPERRRDILWAVSRLHVELSPIAKTELDGLTPERPEQEQALSAFKNAETR